MQSDTKKFILNKRLKGNSREELAQLTKTELIDKVIQLKAHNFQLKNILQKQLNTNSDNTANSLRRHDRIEISADRPHSSADTSVEAAKKRKFDFKKAHKRHVLLKLMYFGWDYLGFACQEHSNATIEYHLFQALTQACLIESRESSNYHRCGRTDKDVSAACQVISIDLRSKFSLEDQMAENGIADEIDYCGILNRILPKNIRCVSWMPLRSEVYSARFDCIGRTYRYYFPRGDLNIEAMREACKLLERHTDFRNFCKMDVHNGVTNYMRNLSSARIHVFNKHSESADPGYAMYFLEIKANAFLWHQIRCIMAVLLLVGEGVEDPEIVSELLNIECNPCKPQYMPAMGQPLSLFDCDFRTHSSKPVKNENSDIDERKNHEPDEPTDTSEWVYTEENLSKLIETVQSEWTQISVKEFIIRDTLQVLEKILYEKYNGKQVTSQPKILHDATKLKNYQKLLSRQRCESLENRIEHFVKKQKLILLNS